MVTKLLVLCLSLAVPSFGARPFIIGGNKVSSISDYPHMCSLSPYARHWCGAVIISRDWLVTSASCATTHSDHYIVRCGSLHWGRGAKHDISNIKIHEDYDQNSPNDIAVVKVSTPLDLSGANMAAITMATTDQTSNPECYITGWGYTIVGGDHDDIQDGLVEANVQVFTNTFCQTMWKQETNITDSQVCIGGIGKGACTYDKGGPLVCKVNGELQLVGVMSFHTGGCFSDHPTVCSRVSYFRDWIKAKTGV